MKIKYYLLSFLMLIFFSEIHSLPRFSLRGGGGDCLGCHVNPTGGNMRNKSGWGFGKNVLPMITPEDDFQMSNKIGDNIQLGLDLRGQTLLKTIPSTDGNKYKIDFQRMTGSIYTNIDLSEKINVFTRYDFIQQIWEAYGVAHILPNNSYVKGGAFQPNYGIRLDDHTAYIRGGDLDLLFSTNVKTGLLYDPRYIETGVELGFYFSDFAFLTASVGNPRSSLLFEYDPVYTANLKIQPEIGENKALFFGGSIAAFRGFIPIIGRVFPEVKMYGGYVGFGIGDFTIMGEYDMANDYLYKDSASTALMVEVAYRIIKGLEAVVRLDRFDPNSDIDKDEYTRVIIGFEIFPYSFIEIKPQYRIQMEDPSIDNDSALIQFHIWY
ncbi:MAG: hypothetical protein A2V93_08505 [Ignavibacteria bacterium RBG_16_34_14]|nr:MAG: hypothetical protein A2V93_08505 [Ignavibacteria bacterium RBG_16_34_14]